MVVASQKTTYIQTINRKPAESVFIQGDNDDFDLLELLLEGEQTDTDQRGLHMGRNREKYRKISLRDGRSKWLNIWHDD